MIMCHKFLSLEHEIVVHPAPSRVFYSGKCVDLEWDERRSVNGFDSLEVLVPKICLVIRDFAYLEVLGCLFQQRDKVRGIVSFPTGHVYAGNNMGVHAAHEMNLNPFPVVSFLPVLFIKPADETRSSETRRVNSEICFNCLQGETTHHDQVLKNGCHVGVSEIVCNRIEVGSAGNQTIGVSIPKVASEAAGREAG